MKLTKQQLKQIIQEELAKIVEQPQFRTGVPEEDILAHGTDTEKYPTTNAERESERIAHELEVEWIRAGNDLRDLGFVDNDIIDMAMDVRNGDMSMKDALEKVWRLR